MPAKRYYTATLPVDHINGKMAPVATICSNTDDPEHAPEVSFWYGYKHRATPHISRYGIRTVHRDLTTNPYTPKEDENRTLFTASLTEVYKHQKYPPDWALMQADFKMQSRYKTEIGYAVAAVRSNGGVWLQEWVSG